MNFSEQLINDLSQYRKQEAAVLLYTGNGADMIKKLRQHMATTNLFFFCDSRNYPIKQRTIAEYRLLSDLKYNQITVDHQDIFKLGDNVELDKFVDLIKKKYKKEYASHIKFRLSETDQMISRFELKFKEESNTFSDYENSVLYFTLMEPITFLEFILYFLERNEINFPLGLVIRGFVSWPGGAEKLKPNSQLVKRLNPVYIAAPNNYWHNPKSGKAFFDQKKTLFDPPVTMDNHFSLCYKKDQSADQEENYFRLRTLKEVGLVN